MSVKKYTVSVRACTDCKLNNIITDKLIHEHFEICPRCRLVKKQCECIPW